MEINEVTEIAKDNIRVNALLSASVNALTNECKNLLSENESSASEHMKQMRELFQKNAAAAGDQHKQVILGMENKSSHTNDHLDRIKGELTGLIQINSQKQEENYKSLSEKLKASADQIVQTDMENTGKVIAKIGAEVSRILELQKQAGDKITAEHESQLKAVGFNRTLLWISLATNVVLFGIVLSRLF